jgi:preprotein translocase subunit SecE
VGVAHDPEREAPLMARETRAQRRARRAQEADGAAAKAGGAAAKSGGAPAKGGGSLTQRARARQQQVRPGAQPVKSQGGRGRQERKGSFAAESWGELKKVDWPNQRQVTQGTIVVIIACAIVGAYLYLLDTGMSRLVDLIV